jgi:hypothetical protein
MCSLVGRRGSLSYTTPPDPTSRLTVTRPPRQQQLRSFALQLEVHLQNLVANGRDLRGQVLAVGVCGRGA